MVCKIYKYALELTSKAQIITAPGWFVFRHFAIQDGKLTVWGEVLPSEPDSRHTFVIIGTGSDIPSRWNYCGTLQDGGMVRHLYQKPAHVP